MDYAKKSLRLREEWKGEIEAAAVPVAGRDGLSPARTPGAARL